jgi:hypothetical protein
VGATGTSYSLLGGAGALSGTTDNGATLEDACRILRGSTTCVTQDSDLSGGLDYGYCAAIIVWTFGTVGTIFEEDSC